MKPKIYLAHPMAYYHSPIAAAAIAQLATEFDVISPSEPQHQQQAKTLRDKFGSAAAMAYFTDNLVPQCNALAFITFTHKQVGAGIRAEVEAAWAKGIDVYHLEPNTAANGKTAFMLHAITNWDGFTLLDIAATRAANQALRPAL